MEIRSEQMDELARAAFIEKLDASFSRDLPDFKEIEGKDRLQFLSLTIDLAATKGMSSEQGIASYALALWYLGAEFEGKSDDLQSLLASSYPEVRKIHGLNQWVEAAIGDPDDITAADDALKRSLRLTEPWGTQ